MISRFVIGDTARISWIESGVTPSSIYAYVYTGSETLVDSGAMTSSGNGHYYYDHSIPNTPGFYVTETHAVINAKSYKRRVVYEAVLIEVD